MSFSERVYVGLGSRNGSPLTLNELDKAIDEFWEEIKTDMRLRDKAKLAGIDEPALANIPADAIVPRQEGGFDPVVTPIVVTFATKVAYDLWKEVFLPNIREKWGANTLKEKSDGKQSRSHSAR